MKTVCRNRSTKLKHGSTLLEVLLATGILSFSLSAIGQLATTGMNAGLRVQYESDAALFCQIQLELLRAGGLPLRSVSEVPIQDAPEWLYSLDITPLQNGIFQVFVEVQHVSGNKFAHAEAVQLLHSVRLGKESL